MSTEPLISQKFECQLNIRMLYERINEIFSKELGFGYVALDIDRSCLKPDIFRGSIYGYVDRKAFFLPGFLLRKTTGDYYEFGYLLRGHSNGFDGLKAVSKKTLDRLAANNTISNLSDQSRVGLNKVERIELGL